MNVSSTNDYLREEFDHTIDRMENRLEAMKHMPDWAVGMVIGLSITACLICCQLLFMLFVFPMCWDLRRYLTPFWWKERLRDDDDVDASDTTEVPPVRVVEMTDAGPSFSDVVRQPHSPASCRAGKQPMRAAPHPQDMED